MTKCNRGYSYNMMFVGPGWMSEGGCWESDYASLLKSNEDDMAYYGELKKQGQLQDLTASEFADVYRQNLPYTRPKCTLWKDIFYGSIRQMFWYADPSMRFCLNMNQGGAMVDLRPYAAKLIRPAALAPKRIKTPRIRSSCSRYIVRASPHTTQAKARSRVARSVTEANKLISAPVTRSHFFQKKRHSHRHA